MTNLFALVLRVVRVVLRVVRVDIAWDNLFEVDSGKINHKQGKCQKHASKQDIEYVFFSINKFSAPVQFDFLTQIIFQIM